MTPAILNFLGKQKSRPAALFFLVVIALLLRLYKLETLFNFDYDAAFQAQYAYQLLANHKFSLVGQELSFQGFFLGPVHSLVEAVPYFFCNLSPACTPYFFASIGFLTGVMFYLLFRRILGPKVTFLAVFIYLISYAQIKYEMGVNSNNLIIPTVLLSLFCLVKYFGNKNKFLVPGSFLLGLAVINFNPVVVLFAVAFAIAALLRPKRNYRIFIISIFAFLLNLLPLLIFNLRHENLLITNFIKFLAINSQPHDYLFKSGELIWNNLLPFYLNYLSIGANIITKLGLIIVLVIGLIYLKNDLKNKRIFWFFAGLIIIYILGFTLYASHVPPYYFTATLPIFLLIIATAIVKYKLPLIIFIVAFTILNVTALARSSSQISYKYKNQAVRYIIEDSRDKSFKLYNDMAIGANTGYNTLFKIYGKEPKEEGELLYIMDLLSDKTIEIKTLRYRWIYGEKNLVEKDFGAIHVTAVK